MAIFLCNICHRLRCVVALQELMANQRFTEGHLDVGLALLPHDDPQQEHTSQNGTMVAESAPHGQLPLGIANRHNNTKQPTYRLILASNFDWLTRDRHAMRDLTAVAKEDSHYWVPIQDFPFDEIILFAYAADHSSRPMYVCLPSGLYLRAAVEF